VPGARHAQDYAGAAAPGKTRGRGGRGHQPPDDAILIKNNHITAAGGIRAAIDKTRGSGKPVEVEVRSREELETALACGANHLLLDNFSPEEAAEAVRYISGRARVEISGGVTLETVRAYAESGADFVSVGALTHSAPAADLSFRLL
jgi:nicotinate-nucleotide pyrophosphorylase (carboxylating)